MITLTMAKALNAGMRRALEADPKVVIAGEDVGKLGGVFRVTEGLQKDFGEHRVIDSPLAESGIVGTAVGMALRGYRPVCEIQFDGFVYPAFDQIVSQLARLHYRSRGLLQMPIVIRVPYGGGIGAVEHHSESPEAYFCHTPGLKVVTCSDPVDAYWMIQVARPGTDVTLIAYGPMVKTCLDAAEAAAEEGHQLEVIDLRTLSPLDMAVVYESVQKTGRVVTVHEAQLNLGLGAELAARITEQCFYSLEAPVLRVGGFDIPYPPSRVEEEYLPDLDRVLDMVDRSLAY
jgi:pyruvate dehydrogenase E1 component beta subunit